MKGGILEVERDTIVFVVTGDLRDVDFILETDAHMMLCPVVGLLIGRALDSSRPDAIGCSAG